jgi:Flp pilus assembly pilin Flp
MGPLVRRFGADEQGAAVIEYALLSALVSISIIALLPSMGVSLVGIFNQVVAGFK